MIAFTNIFFILQLVLFVVLSIWAVQSSVIIRGNLLIMISAAILALIPLHYTGPILTSMFADQTKIDSMLEFFLFTLVFAGYIHLIAFLIKKFIFKKYYKVFDDTILSLVFANLYPVYAAIIALIILIWSKNQWFL